MEIKEVQFQEANLHQHQTELQPRFSQINGILIPEANPCQGQHQTGRKIGLKLHKEVLLREKNQLRYQDRADQTQK